MAARKKLRPGTPAAVQPEEMIDEVPTESAGAIVAAPTLKRGRVDDTGDGDEQLQADPSGKIIDAANEILRRSNSGSSLVFERRFRSHFGVSPNVAARCWSLLQLDAVDTDSLTDLHTVDRFLWGLLLLMTYGTESVNCTAASGVDESTFRQWAWDFVDKIADLEPDVIVWENRKVQDEGNDCLTSIDCTDCRYEINQREFSSYKFKKKGGLRYLVVICIKTGHIVWIDGPFPAGLYNDIKCLRWSVLDFLGENERMEGDDGFIGECPKHVKCPGSFVREEEMLEMQNRVRSRHEYCNKRLKQFGCLKERFRHHDFDKHAVCFRAVAVLTQLAIEAGEPLWDVEYSDNLPQIAN